MAFGQQSGPPATHRQLQELLALLEGQGYTSFRDARGPMGFTQRQGGGKFTASEADEVIGRLQADAEAASGIEAGTAPPVADQATTSSEGAATPRRVRARGDDAATTLAAQRRAARQATSVRDLPARALARELERRGWIVIPPEGQTAPDVTDRPPPT